MRYDTLESGWILRTLRIKNQPKLQKKCCSCTYACNDHLNKSNSVTLGRGLGRLPISSCPYCSRWSHRFMHYPSVVGFLCSLNILLISMYHISNERKPISRQQMYDLLFICVDAISWNIYLPGKFLFKPCMWSYRLFILSWD